MYNFKYYRYNLHIYCFDREHIYYSIKVKNTGKKLEMKENRRTMSKMFLNFKFDNLGKIKPIIRNYFGLYMNEYFITDYEKLRTSIREIEGRGLLIESNVNKNLNCYKTY